MTIRLGVIGSSPGNGHPYSWSAIFNGYDPVEMGKCEFPVIPRYLAQRKWPDDKLTSAKVTHIWTQNFCNSEKIARASLIPNIVHEVEDMLSQVDGVLLARDDYENHIKFAGPVLDAGLPIYIDKPIAITKDAHVKLMDMSKYRSQIFTCSALRFAQELAPSKRLLESIGSVKFISGVTPKSWNKYAIHIVEPILNISGSPINLDLNNFFALPNNGGVFHFHTDSKTIVQITALGDGVEGPTSIRLHGDQGYTDLVFSDPFSAFKAALAEFCSIIQTGKRKKSAKFDRDVVSIISQGNQ